MEHCSQFSQENLILESLQIFFTQCYESDNTSLTPMLDIINSKHRISLRLLDWFITNYCKKKKIMFSKPDGSNFYIYNNYKCQLKAFSKKFFDPFCRSYRIKFIINSNSNIEISTTIGQLNFFRWIIKSDIISYIMESIDIIEHEITYNNGNKRQRRRRTKYKNKNVEHDDSSITSTSTTTSTSSEFTQHKIHKGISSTDTPIVRYDDKKIYLKF